MNEKFRTLKCLLNVIQMNTQPCNGHTDPNSINDCWTEVFEILDDILNPTKPYVSDDLPGLNPVGLNEVAAFSKMMVLVLNNPKNLQKGGWKDCDLGFLDAKLMEEKIELIEAVFNLNYSLRMQKSSVDIKQCRERVLREAADVANIAMMIADICGALKE